MRLLGAAVFAGAILALAPGVAARATSDVPLRVIVDGQPVVTHGVSGYERHAKAFVNIVAAVKTIGGLLVFEKLDEVRVTIGAHTVRFFVGHPTALLDDVPIRLQASPFVKDGDTFVPLVTLARLASARLTIDGRQRLAVLVLGVGTGFPPALMRTDGVGDVAPSPTQALTFATTATSDASGLHAQADITNVTARPYTIEFPSAKQVEFIVARNGTEVWNSGARVAGPGPTSLTIAPHETKIFTKNWSGFAELGPGRYSLRLRLATLIPLDTSPISVDTSPSRELR